jgi:hypothetical protein
MQRAQDQYDDLARVSCARFGQSRYRGAAAPRYWSCPPLRCPCRVGPLVLNTRSPKSLAGTCKPSLWPCQARAPGNVFSRPETQGPKLPLSGPFSWWRLKASLNARAKSRVFGKPREISVSTRVRGGGRSRIRTCLQKLKFPANREINREFFSFRLVRGSKVVIRPMIQRT